jgi:hypothetical protein
MEALAKPLWGVCKREVRIQSEYSLPRGFAAKKRGGNWK